MRWVQYQHAGTVTAYLPERPDAAGLSARVLDPAGGVLQAAATIAREATDTTLASPATAGTRTLVATSAADVQVGRRYQLGGTEDAGGEDVLVRAKATNTLTLARPIRTDRAAGVTLRSTRVDVTVSTASTATCQRHLVAEVTYTVTSARPLWVEDFDVTRYAPQTALTLEALRAIDPIVAKRLPEGTWWPELRDLTWDRLLRRVAGKVAPGALVGTVDLTDAHGYLVLADLATGDPDRGPALEARFRQELDATLASSAIDSEQAGVVDSTRTWGAGIPMVRR